MAIDISSNLAAEIDAGKTFDKSDNPRCGKNRVMITNIRGDLIDNGNQKNEYAFIEYVPLTAEPNPQIEGDRMGFGYVNGAYVPGTGALIDDGTHPNAVGSKCAVKANFTGNRNVAASKIKQFFLAAFNVRESDVKPGEIGGSWEDASRQVAGWYVKGWKLGDNVVPPGTPNAVEKWVNLTYAGGGFVPVTQQTPGAVWKEANPLAGLVIDVTNVNAKKRTPNDKGAYVCAQRWSCIAPVNVGENSPEARKKRLSDYASQITAEAADDDDGSAFLAANAASTASTTMQASIPNIPAIPNVPIVPPIPVAPQPPKAQDPVAPTAPPVADPNWPPKSPWEGPTAATASWMKSGFVWSNPANGGDNTVLAEAEYRAGKRSK